MMLQLPFFSKTGLLIIGTATLVMLIAFDYQRYRFMVPARAYNAIILGLSLCQVGEFAFVLSKAGNEYNLLTDNQYQVFLGVSILSMALPPI